MLLPLKETIKEKTQQHIDRLHGHGRIQHNAGDEVLRLVQHVDGVLPLNGLHGLRVHAAPIGRLKEGRVKATRETKGSCN